MGPLPLLQDLGVNLRMLQDRAVGPPWLQDLGVDLPLLQELVVGPPTPLRHDLVVSLALPQDLGRDQRDLVMDSPAPWL